MRSVSKSQGLILNRALHLNSRSFGSATTVIWVQMKSWTWWRWRIQHFRQLGQADKTKATLRGNFMKDARLEIVKPSLLTKAVEVIKNLAAALRRYQRRPLRIPVKQADYRRDNAKFRTHAI